MTATLPGKALAEELQAESRADALRTPMARLIEAAASHALTEDHYFRLIGQLWAMKRMYDYVYGAWGSSLTINQYPPSIDDLFAKPIYDDSTQEMLYGHTILQQALERGKALEESFKQGDYTGALGGYSGEGPRMSMNQMSTHLLSVPVAEQEKYLDLLRMRARQLWDEVKHGSLHAVPEALVQYEVAAPSGV